MMSAFLHFQHTLNRLLYKYKVILILDKLFLKYERRDQIDPPPEQTTLKKPSLIRVKQTIKVNIIDK